MVQSGPIYPHFSVILRAPFLVIPFSFERIVLLDFIHRLASQEQTMTMEAEPVSKMLCHFFLDTFSLCATACLCVFCIGILAPLCVVFCE